MQQVEIIRVSSSGDHEVGTLFYHNHELIRVTHVGREKPYKSGTARTYKFRVIGKVNLDRVLGGPTK